MPLCEKCEVRLPGQLGDTSTPYPSVLADEEEREQYVLDVEGLANKLEADQVLPEIARRSLREEAMSLHHQLRHENQESLL